MNFFRVFGSDDKFWFLNLKYYEKKRRTIFEDFQFPSFDWGAYDLVVHKICKNIMAGVKVYNRTRADVTYHDVLGWA